MPFRREEFLHRRWEHGYGYRKQGKRARQDICRGRFFRLFLDYCLTTIFLLPQLNMRPWRSWIARVTPTHKVAGSNPVGRTKMP